MRGALRADRHGVGALYGAFAVVAVATVVLASMAQSVPRSHPPLASPPAGEVSDLFLEAILSSSEGSEGTSVRQALATFCRATPCPPETLFRPLIPDNISRAAGPLGHSLGRPWSFSVSNATGLLFSVGDLPPNVPATASREDILHRGDGAYLTATIRLGTS